MWRKALSRVPRSQVARRRTTFLAGVGPSRPGILRPATDRNSNRRRYRMRVMKILAAAALAAFVSAVFAGPSAADVIKVSPGDSIQAAIDSAGTYDTIKLAPGTYQETVQIKKDGITLKGAGADKPMIEPAS